MQQGLDGSSRCDPSGANCEREHAFLIGQGDKRNAKPIAFRKALGRATGISGGNPLPIWSDNLFDDRSRQFVMLRQSPHRIADLGV